MLFATDGYYYNGKRIDSRPVVEGIAAVRACLADIGARFPRLVELYDNTASLQDRTVATGFLKPALARQYGAGGYVGRGSGRAFDARRMTICSRLL